MALAPSMIIMGNTIKALLFATKEQQEIQVELVTKK